MAVDVSQETALINQAIRGKEVRKSLSGGIQKIADEVNKFEGESTNQQGEFEQEMQQKQDTFENAIQQKQDSFESAMNTQQTVFQDNIIQKQNTFESTMQQDQADYENSINGQWNNYKQVMDADEATRQRNEQTRQGNEEIRKTNENERVANENERKQNEVTRQGSETTRQENEQTRETAFAGMEHVDANLELSTARGIYGTLGERLDARLGQAGTKSVDESNLQDNYVLRYDAHTDKLVYVEDKIDRTPPGVVNNFIATKGNDIVILSWDNPIDADFIGVKILRKEGSAPTSLTDGILVYAGANTSYTDSNVTSGTNYYYRIFPYDMQSNYNSTEEGQIVNITPIHLDIYGIKIDTTNSNPETAITYTDDAAGFTPASCVGGVFNYGSWQDKFPFNLIKPCTFKDGVVQDYLNPNDFSKKQDGTAAQITLGYDNDVMIEFPKIYWKFEKIGTDLYIKYSNGKVDDTYKCLAHTRGEIEKDKIYIATYLSCMRVNNLASVSGQMPRTTEYTSIDDIRTIARKSSGYDLLGYYQLLMLQILFVLMFKNRNSIIALGPGYAHFGHSAGVATGGANAQGMFWGNTSDDHVKFCGVEDIWGNFPYFVDAIATDSQNNLLIGNNSFNNNGEGYVNYGQFTADPLQGYISNVQGTTETGFIPKTVGGSSTTYYCDNCQIASNKSIAVVGTAYNAGILGGIFKMVLENYGGDILSTRLMYL